MPRRAVFSITENDIDGLRSVFSPLSLDYEPTHSGPGWLLASPQGPMGQHWGLKAVISLAVNETNLQMQDNSIS
jgi:hypothetical protein